MFPDPKNDLFFFLSILESIGKINRYLVNINSAEDFIHKEDQLYFNATLTLLANLGEAFGKLSKESRSFFSKMDVDGIRALRNRIVHDYTGINSFRIYNIFVNNRPSIRNNTIDVLKKHLNNAVVDMKEYHVAKDSHFYNNVPFNEIY